MVVTVAVLVVAAAGWQPATCDRALLGEFPPGSTFKVVTASALARAGMRPSSAVQCPSQVDIGGRISAIEDGTWLPPQLVISPARRQAARPHAISPAILDTLRPMMRAVVTTGTAAGVGFPPGWPRRRQRRPDRQCLPAQIVTKTCPPSGPEWPCFTHINQ